MVPVSNKRTLTEFLLRTGALVNVTFRAYGSNAMVMISRQVGTCSFIIQPHAGKSAGGRI
jgi:hypothetical protein